MTLPDIVRFTGLSAKQTKECLIILIQHGIVYFSEAPEGKVEPTYYTIDPERIMMRLRMGPILRDVSERYGKEAEIICKLLFLNGRMTMRGVIQWVKDNMKKGRMYAIDTLEYICDIKTIYRNRQIHTSIFATRHRSVHSRRLARTQSFHYGSSVGSH